VTRMYRWALAHERAQNAWARPSVQRKQAHAIAVAYAREMSLPTPERRESLKAWQEIYFDAKPDLGVGWYWITAEGTKESAYQGSQKMSHSQRPEIMCQDDAL